MRICGLQILQTPDTTPGIGFEDRLLKIKCRILQPLGCGAYLRYVDDFALFSDNKQRLWAWKQAIIDRLQETLIHSAKGASGSESLEREISIVAKEKELAMRMQKDANEVRSEVTRQMNDLANQQNLQQKQLRNLRRAAEAAEKLDERRKQRFSQRQELARKVREGA